MYNIYIYVYEIYHIYVYIIYRYVYIYICIYIYIYICIYIYKHIYDLINKIDNFAVPPSYLLLQWMSSHYIQVFLIMKGLLECKRNMTINQIGPFLLRLLQHS